MTTLLFAGHCWSVTPVEDPREQLPAPSLVQECGLSSDHVFRGRLIRLHSGPGFSGFIRELDGLTYASYFGTQEALRTAKIEGMATFWSTSRNELWIKGKTSGDFLEIIEIRVNCEQNSILYKVKPRGKGACHTKDANGVPRQGCYYRKLNSEGSLEFDQ